MTNLVTKIDNMVVSGQKFISPSGQELQLVNIEVLDDAIIADFAPFHLGDGFTESDLIPVVQEYDYQDIERIEGGYEYPNIVSVQAWPGDEGFDRDLAAELAIDELFGQYVRERIAA